MLNECCYRQDLDYNSLVFNAGNINSSEEEDYDEYETIPLGSATSNIRISGWRIATNSTNEYSVTFNVPRDAINSNRKEGDGYRHDSNKGGRTKVFVHLLTDNSNTPDGNRFSIKLSSLFTRACEVVSIDDLKCNVACNVCIQNSPANYYYNHYVLEFDICQCIKAEDFALLSVSRISTANDYAGDLFLTSIEFRYMSN